MTAKGLAGPAEFAGPVFLSLFINFWLKIYKFFDKGV